MIIYSKFHDLGFGSKEIDTSTTPFDNMSLEYLNNGFGNSDFFSADVNDYDNELEFNFGSKLKILEEQRYSFYSYDQIMERGSIIISKESSNFILIKNKRLLDPSIQLNVRNFRTNKNTTLNFTKKSSRKFEVFNYTDRDVIVDYVASKSIPKIRKLENLDNFANSINNIIQRSNLD